MGIKIVEEYWTMGAYDAVVVVEAPDDETVSAFMLKVGSLGNVRRQTLRVFRRMAVVLARLKCARASGACQTRIFRQRNVC